MNTQEKNIQEENYLEAKSIVSRSFELNASEYDTKRVIKNGLTKKVNLSYLIFPTLCCCCYDSIMSLKVLNNKSFFFFTNSVSHNVII